MSSWHLFENQLEQIARITEAEARLTKEISDAQTKISSLTTQIAEADRELRNEKLNKNSALNQVANQEKKLRECGKQLEEKESEISKLKSNIRNQAHLSQWDSQQHQQLNTAYQQACRQAEFLQAEKSRLSAQNNHLQMRLQNVCMGANQMENELRFHRANAGQIVGQNMKFYCRSEYEILLSEKNALIAEYESGNDSEYLSDASDY